MPTTPLIELTYCRLCGWGLRAGWMRRNAALPHWRPTYGGLRPAAGLRQR